LRVAAASRITWDPDTEAPPRWSAPARSTWGRTVPAVEVSEQVTFSGEQSGTIGHSTLDAHGDFALTSPTPRH